MKNRVRKIANFFAFNLLFFSLYLNFIHKDKLSISASQHSAAFSETVFGENPELVNEKDIEANVTIQQTTKDKVSESNAAALKLSIN